MVITAVHCGFGLDLNPQCIIQNCNTCLTYPSQEQWYSKPQVFKLRGVKSIFVWSSKAVLSLSSSVQPHFVSKGTETWNRDNRRKAFLATIMIPLLLFWPFDCSLPPTILAWFCSTLKVAATEKAGRCYPSYADTRQDIAQYTEHFSICKQTSLHRQLWHLWIKVCIWYFQSSCKMWCLLSALRTQALICPGHFTGLFTIQIKIAILRLSEKLQKWFSNSLKNVKIFIIKRVIQQLTGGQQEAGKGKSKQIRRGTRPNGFPSTQWKMQAGASSLIIHILFLCTNLFLRKGKNLKEHKW